MNSDNWASVSREAKQLVKQLTRVDPKKRFTAAQALADPWFSGISGVESELTVSTETAGSMTTSI